MMVLFTSGELYPHFVVLLEAELKQKDSRKIVMENVKIPIVVCNMVVETVRRPLSMM